MDQQQITDRQVAFARSTLTERLAALERRVVGTTEEAVDNVKATAATVRSAVTGATHDIQGVMSQVSGGVRDSLDISQHVRAHPWETLGLAAGVGFLAGFLPRPGRGSARVGQLSLVGDLLSVLRRELMGVGEATIAAGAAALKQNLQAPRTPYESARSPHLNGQV